MRVLRVAPAEVDAVWLQAAPLLARALALNRCIDVEDTYAMIRNGAMQLLVVEDAGAIVAALATEVVEYPKLRSLRIVLCGGERLVEWLDEVHALLEDGARRAGCTVLEITGRGGWVRALKRFGYQDVLTTIQKTLEVQQ